MGESHRGLVLFVEDDADTCEFAEVYLMSQGFRCRAARTAEAALAAAHVIRFDVIVIDIGLGGPVDGASLARQLLALHDPSPIVFQSGYQRERLPTDIPHAGYLFKPWTPEALVAAISNAIDTGRL